MVEMSRIRAFWIQFFMDDMFCKSNPHIGNESFFHNSFVLEISTNEMIAISVDLQLNPSESKSVIFLENLYFKAQKSEDSALQGQSWKANWMRRWFENCVFIEEFFSRIDVVSSCTNRLKKNKEILICEKKQKNTNMWKKTTYHR